jgi:class 3 adenylate cyclase
MSSPHYTKHLTGAQLAEIQLHIDPGDIGVNIELGKKIDHECAIAFFDLCGFTAISFKLSTEQTLAILQGLFKYISERVVLFKGMIDKYPGDGVVAFFPKLKTDKEEHVDRSLACGSVVMEWFYSYFRYRHQRNNPDLILDLAIGLDAGKTSIAHVGTNVHSELVLLGNQVNCASKCQQAAKKEEFIIGNEAKGKVKHPILYNFSPGPDIGVPGYNSFKVDWQEFMTKATWLEDKK